MCSEIVLENTSLPCAVSRCGTNTNGAQGYSYTFGGPPGSSVGTIFNLNYSSWVYDTNANFITYPSSTGTVSLIASQSSGFSLCYVYGAGHNAAGIPTFTGSRLANGGVTATPGYSFPQMPSYQAYFFDRTWGQLTSFTITFNPSTTLPDLYQIYYTVP